jgi:hypothetical protein
MSNFCNLARGAMITAMLVSMTGCGGGGSDDPPPSEGNPPAPVPSPPPPPPAPTVPPLSSTIVSLTDNHAVGTDHWADGNTANGGQGAPVQGIECLLNMPENYHVHTHVSIFLDGVALAVPPEIGIHDQLPSRCFYGIHTHDKSGKIHIEAAAPGTFTLGQLFAIWGQPLETDNVAGLTGKPIVVYSTDNATVTKVDSGWKDIELTTHKEITIQVGTPITEIPNFTWNGN